MRRPLFAILLAGILLACSAADELGQAPGTTPVAESAATNVVLVSIDTLRADHLGAYGYPLATSPQIDTLARDGVLFEQAIAMAPSTLPSHAAIFSSRVSTLHGASNAHKTRLNASSISLAEVLADAGWRAFAVHGGGQLSPEFGLDRGFEGYEHVATLFSDAVARGCKWIEQVRPEPFFLFLHTYEVHHPYRPRPEHLARFDGDYAGELPDQIEIDEHLRRINGHSEPRLEIDDADLAHIIHTYDAEILSVDEAVGELVECLKAKGLYDRTLLVLTSDHGEEFGEHGKVGWHHHTLFEELLRVPLIVKLPHSRRAGERVAEQVRGIDVAPTVLGALNLPRPRSYQGRDLFASAATHGELDTFAVSQRDTLVTTPETVSIREGRWKLYGGRLFDLRTDPGERQDVAPQHPDIVRRLEAALARIQAGEDELEPAVPADVSEETRQRLRELGYVD